MNTSRFYVIIIYNLLIFKKIEIQKDKINACKTSIYQLDINERLWFVLETLNVIFELYQKSEKYANAHIKCVLETSTYQ